MTVGAPPAPNQIVNESSITTPITDHKGQHRVARIWEENGARRGHGGGQVVVNPGGSFDSRSHVPPDVQEKAVRAMDEIF